MVNASAVCLLTCANTVRHSIVPPLEALNSPASVIAAAEAGVFAGNVATYTTSLLLFVVLVRLTRALSVPSVVSAAAAAVAAVIATNYAFLIVCLRVF